MRRYCVVFCWVALLQLMRPAPALAWWDYLEQFSGPGPFFPFAFDFDMRLWCFPGAPPAGGGAGAGGGISAKVFRTAGGKFTWCLNKPHPDRLRLASIDLGLRYATERDDRFAGNERIHFVSLQPGFSLAFMRNPARDVLEYGAGAGVYWFKSKGFERNFHGGFIEPARFDIRFPTDKRTEYRFWSKYWYRRAMLRVGGMLFVNGFEPDAFAPRPDVRKSSAMAEYVPYLAFYFDFEPPKK
jgi:hypothetical protein